MSLHSINQYYKELEKIIHYGGTKKETSIRNPFYNLLNEYAKGKGLMLITEVTIKGSKGKNVTPDGCLKDSLRQDWGYWESKDEADIIDEEIKRKFSKGYPQDNILFEDSQTAILYQTGHEVLRISMKEPEQLDEIIKKFISYQRPEVRKFYEAIELFKQDIPIVTKAIKDIILEHEKTNKNFIAAESSFFEICKESINPVITLDDIREMMIQHILTEDIFNTIFDETQFHRENNIARELEKVIQTFFIGAVRHNTLDKVQNYQAINASAATIADHHEKQMFLKVVYETFYKYYNPKAADRLGVVYTPNEIVKFMVESTDYLLHHHFGKGLEDKGVEILDPATGTGTFICDIIDYIRQDKLPYKYEHEIHANEIAILPYYIANLNIEYTFKQKTGKYKEFESLCFVDTLDNVFANLGTDRAIQKDMFLFTIENLERIKKQNSKKISVIIGNPPYNANQMNENDNNKNRTYFLTSKETAKKRTHSQKTDKRGIGVDDRIKETFVKYSTAQKTKVYDMYARFYRWSMDRIGNDGIICFITNNSFINARTFDGFRKCVQNNFQQSYIINLGGNIRELSGKDGIFLNENHTIFGQAAAVGIAMMWLVKDSKNKSDKCKINYIHPTDIRATRDEKLAYLQSHSFKDISFDNVQPDKKNNWINLSEDNDWEDFIPICSKDVKQRKNKTGVLFELYSNGIATNRDEWVYDFDKSNLINKMIFFHEVYNKAVEAWGNYKKLSNYVDKSSDSNPEVDKFLVDYSIIKWSKMIKRDKLRKLKLGAFNEQEVCSSLYRPFVQQHFYFGYIPLDVIGQQREIFPTENLKNFHIAINQSDKPFNVICSKFPVDLHFNGDSVCCPLFQFDEHLNCLENITDWGMQQFHEYYKETTITKEDIFHFVYAVLHNPEYRKKYELNLKRDFPRIPFYTDFNKWATWGKQLMDFHINYETVKPFDLKEITVKDIENPKPKLKAYKETGTIILDEATILSGIPDEAWQYKLGNRSALEWILDQYKEKKPADPTIAEKFNTYRFADYKDHVIDLIKRVTTVSIETMKIIREMEIIKEPTDL